ncbi:hypothetical protein [Oceanobacillus jeddahense]|uniref:hypothetical protein n=1 Tax=Oceanobacillus jeddahense TaxID=1462527 RepID=UPI000595AC2A|nr:hypothetical protein [Oceanobacillus jeddahense]
MDILKLIMKKLFVAILGSFLFSSVLAIIANAQRSPEEERPPEQIGFDDAFLLVFIVSSIISIIGGIPASLIIDEIMKKFSKRIFKYILHPILYIFAGGVVTGLFHLFLQGRIGVYLSILGMIAAFCFYIVSISINKIIQISKEQEEEDN